MTMTMDRCEIAAEEIFGLRHSLTLRVKILLIGRYWNNVLVM